MSQHAADRQDLDYQDQGAFMMHDKAVGALVFLGNSENPLLGMSVSYGGANLVL